MKKAMSYLEKVLGLNFRLNPHIDLVYKLDM